MCLTEIQRFPLFFSRSRLISVKFVQNTLFWVPIASGEGPLKVAVHSKLGPHFDKFRSPLHVGAVVWFSLKLASKTSCPVSVNLCRFIIIKYHSDQLSTTILINNNYYNDQASISMTVLYLSQFHQ